MTLHPHPHRSPSQERLDEWLLRFALWTYEVTGGYLMVTDLQGVLTAEGYTLTDPVVLCTDLTRFGSTNLGAEMMARCRASTEAHLEALAGLGAIATVRTLARNPPAHDECPPDESRGQRIERRIEHGIRQSGPVLANGLTTLPETTETEEW